MHRESRSLNRAARFTAVTDNPREIADTRENMGIYWATMTLTGARLGRSRGTSDLTRTVFLSLSVDTTGSRIVRRREKRRDLAEKTHLVGDFLRPRKHLLRDHHCVLCVLFKNRKISHTHTDVYTCAQTSGAARAALRGASRYTKSAGGVRGRVTSYVCVVDTQGGNPLLPSDVEIGWLLRARHFRRTWS